MTVVNHARRAFLRGRSRSAAPGIRPPWALPEAHFHETCTRCNDCIAHCPEQILRRGDGGFPELDFSRAGCTFCGDCLSVCKPGALQRAGAERGALPLVATISDNCLNNRNVVCTSCRESCEVDAIRFRPQRGGRFEINLLTERCTGCGECLHTCPVGSITVVPIDSDPKEVATHG